MAAAAWETAVVNPAKLAGITLGSDFGEVAEWLQAVTVRISGSGNGSGSGVIWRPGLIITNAHVARERAMNVEFADGTVLPGRLVARDLRSDLAALAVDRYRGTPALPIPTIRDARTLRVGELVIAVGNPLGVDRAVTSGIVHRLPNHRPWIISDVHLAPGNSGGPLADARGWVVGINSMIVDGFGWAVSSHAIARFLGKVQP